MPRDDIEIKTKTRITRIHSVQGGDLAIYQTNISTGKRIFFHHYDAGYGTFAALLFARWYYGLDQEELEIPHAEESKDAINTPNYCTGHPILFLNRLKKFPEEKEIFNVAFSSPRDIAKLTLLDKGLEYRRGADLMLIEKEIINNCLEAIIEVGRSSGTLPGNGFFEIYDLFGEESKNYKSPYKT